MYIYIYICSDWISSYVFFYINNIYLYIYAHMFTFFYEALNINKHTCIGINIYIYYKLYSFNKYKKQLPLDVFYQNCLLKQLYLSPVVAQILRICADWIYIYMFMKFLHQLYIYIYVHICLHFLFKKLSIYKYK